MKKILCLIISVLLCFSLMGCSNKGNKEITNERFLYVEQGYDDRGNSIHILADTKTKTMYMIYGKGITVMLDTEGKPLLWEE